MKNTLIGALLLLTFLTVGCRLGSPVDPEIITEPPYTSVLTSRDSITTGNHLGIGLNEEAGKAYSAIQTLPQTKGVSYLNIVANVSSDLPQLRDRIALYTYILLDGKQGTDTGVQINLKEGVVSSIYLNSGKALNQWPASLAAGSSVRVGDPAAALYEKFVSIRSKSAYASKFERIMLLTKDLSLSFDPAMAQSPQWYFAYSTGADVWDEVKIHLKDGKVAYIIVNHYKNI